ncbi:hypothetical protein [Cryobacterium zhongshanensis]|uniref:Uncharacterized protein n=1 Tax=Cryobacterium zhongshanensis TaxID=2928153 RepID=A0AA41QUW1_9MICO|nr:hypothetical protein [Cryobacterium zhongshanensis]MCI4656686.1 hypothetical protein [Cryobacterium zhongshanensis]
MNDSEFDGDAHSGQNYDASTAARLLNEAERVGARSLARTDFRAHAVIQGWSAAGLFVYVATFLLLFGNPNSSASAVGSGYAHANVLMIPLLVLIQLVQGARNRLPVSSAPLRRGIQLPLILWSTIVFLAAGTATLLGVEYPWWMSLLVAAAVAVPLGGLAIGTSGKARQTTSHPSDASPRPPLSRTAAVVTAGLGAYFGVIAAVTPYSWFPLAAMLFFLALLVQLVGWSARWGLPRVGSEWGQPQWAAFGITFTLLFAITIIAAKTEWNTPLVATISGIVIAAPLACSTIRTYRWQ